jgi:hypothetical protein
MDAFDVGQFVSLLIGGSGIGAWAFTYMQMQQNRRERARAYFHQIVLTPEFLKMLGNLFALNMQIQRYASSEEHAETEAKRLAGVAGRLPDTFDPSFLEFWGRFFFLPKTLSRKIIDVSTLLRDSLQSIVNTGRLEPSAVPAIDAAFDEISRQLKEFFEIEQISQ